MTEVFYKNLKIGKISNRHERINSLGEKKYYRMTTVNLNNKFITVFIDELTYRRYDIVEDTIYAISFNFEIEEGVKKLTSVKVCPFIHGERLDDEDVNELYDNFSKESRGVRKEVFKKVNEELE